MGTLLDGLSQRHVVAAVLWVENPPRRPVFDEPGTPQSQVKDSRTYFYPVIDPHADSNDRAGAVQLDAPRGHPVDSGPAQCQQRPVGGPLGQRR